MKLIFIFLILMLILSGFVVGGGVDEDIIKSFNSREEIVEIIVEIDSVSPDIGMLRLNSDLTSEGGIIDEENIEHRFENSIVMKVNESELNELSKNTNIKSIIKMGKIHALLQDSVDIINASSTWALRSSGINLTGDAQSVCVIDTGINYSHPDLAGNYLGGYDFVDDDSDPMDGHGHGTHVSGIIAANGGIIGISFNSGIVAIRVLDNSGGGSPADLASAIDWCVNNASQFNITTISMSLGCNATVGGYASDCDTLNDACYNPAITSAINAAILNNISVLAASGNFGESDKISSPACIQNATAISSTDKDEEISSFSDRNFLVKLFAPGGSINSTRWNPIGDMIACSENGNYAICSGTSMATPMVAGAIAIINQYLTLSSQSKTPLEIETILHETGVNVVDIANASQNFSRIDVYSALLSLDVDAPNVTLVTPVDDNINLNVNQSFVCNATDWQLANVTFRIWNFSGDIYNESSQNLTGVANESLFSVTDMNEDSYVWNCFVYDALGNVGNSANFSLTIGGVATSLVSPETGSYTSVSDTNFSCSVASDISHELANVTFYLWNSSGNLAHNSTEDISGFSNSSVFNFSFVDEGNYSWNCLGVNNVSNESWGDSNFSVVYDVTYPSLNLTSLPTSVTSNSVVKSFGFNVSDSNLANCSLIVNDAISLTNSSINVSVSQTFSQTFTPGTYIWKINCSDFVGHVNSSSENSFIISAVAVVSIGSSGGGGGGGTSATSVVATPKVFDVSAAEVSSGYTKSLKRDEKVNFSVFDFKGGRHLLSVNEIGVDYVNLTIESEPIHLKLGVGQSAKLNLTSVDYYDLMVKLNGIDGDEAELTIQLISEPIEKVVERIIDGDVIETEVLVIKDYFWVVIVLVVVLVAIVYVVVRRKRSGREDGSSDEGHSPSGKKAKKLKGSKAKKKNGRKSKKAEA